MSILDVFILALVRHGFDSAYRLQAEAGLSVGASLPAIYRLRTRGFIKVGASEGARGRRRLSLTGKGEDQLRTQVDELEDLLTQPPADMESVLRAVTVAQLFGKKSLVPSLLEAAEGEIQKRIAERRATAAVDTSDPVTFYRTATAQCENARSRALIQALRQLAKQLA